MEKTTVYKNLQKATFRRFRGFDKIQLVMSNGKYEILSQLDIIKQYFFLLKMHINSIDNS